MKPTIILAAAIAVAGCNQTPGSHVKCDGRNLSWIGEISDDRELHDVIFKAAFSLCDERGKKAETEVWFAQVKLCVKDTPCKVAATFGPVQYRSRESCEEAIVHEGGYATACVPQPHAPVAKEPSQ